MLKSVASAVRRSPIVAGALSFVLPGLGQVWLGQVLRGMLLVAPLVLLAVGTGLVLATQGVYRSLGLLLQPPVLVSLLLLNAVIVVVRLFAILDAYLLAERGGTRRGTRGARQWIATVVLAALLLATLGEHAALGYVGYQTYDTVTTVFAPPSTPQPSPTPAAPSGTPRPLWTFPPTPSPTPVPTWDSDGRLDLLLIGADSGPGRWSLRTDSLTLLSVDIASGKAALFSIPRNLRRVPLPRRSVNAFECGCFPGLINAIYRYAEDHPEWFIGEDGERGLRALEDSVSAMTRLDLDGYFLVTLNGFVRLVDAMGGVDIYVDEALHDAEYPLEDGSHTVEINIDVGWHHFDGHWALVYSRTRHQDSDYGRMWRQERMLVALRRSMNPCQVIGRVPELLKIAKDSLSTDLPISALPELLDLAARVKASSIARYQFWPPDVPEYLNKAGLKVIRAMVLDPFGVEPTPDPSATPAAPTPTARPGC